MAEKNEIQVSFSDALTDKLVSVEDALPKDFNKVRFVNNAIAVLNSNTQLQKCNRQQLMTGLLRGAYLGLDAMNAEFYLVPFNGSVQFITSYKGACKFAKKYSVRPIKDIYSKVVRNGDEFVEKIVDGHPTIDFKPVPFSNEKIVGVFAVVLFEDGGMVYETMTTEEVNAVRNNYSRAKNSPAWQNSWSEMAKKTIIHRIMKTIECDFESVEAKQAWDDGADSNVVQQKQTGEIVDVFAKNVEQAIPTPKTDEPVIIDDNGQIEMPAFLED